MWCATSFPVPFASAQVTFRLSISIDAIVRSLEDSLSEISVELIPIHNRLITLRRQLVTLAAKEGSHKAELKPLAEEIRKIDSLSIPFTLFIDMPRQWLD